MARNQIYELAASGRRWLMRLTFAASNPKAALVWARRGREGRSDITVDEIARFSGPHPVILEAGAADGLDTERLALRFPEGIVIAVEPIPSAFDRCIRRTHHLGNVIPVKAALSDRVATGTMKVARSSQDGSADSSSLLDPTLHLDIHPGVVFEEQIEVECMTLDSLLESLGLPTPTVLRLDLQGMELRVLQAAPRTLTSVNVVVTEGSRHPLYAGAATFSEVREFLDAKGFDLSIERIGAISGNALFTRKRMPKQMSSVSG